jgi:hypothetical protein
MLVRPLGTQEQAGQCGFTHIAVITADDLTQATAATAQTITLVTLLAFDIIQKVGWYLKTPFKDVSDAAFNSDTMSVGDNAAVTTHIAATEVNENGTEILSHYSNTAVRYTSADKIAVTFNSMAAKSLVNIDVGELHIFFALLRMSTLAGASTGSILLVPKP